MTVSAKTLHICMLAYFTWFHVKECKTPILSIDTICKYTIIKQSLKFSAILVGYSCKIAYKYCDMLGIILLEHNIEHNRSIAHIIIGKIKV